MAEPTYVQMQGVQNQYSDPLDRFWNLYLLDADKEDARMAERWKGDADGILIFTGLFATTVGSFIIATYPSLQSNSADQSAAVLLVVTQQLGQITQLLASPSSPLPSSPLNLTALETFAVAPAAIKINILWILSFFLSLFCALLATLVQQWARTYIGDTQRRGTPRSRGAIHSFLRVGVERFGFNRTVDAIITLLHVSVLLFTAGFLVFMFDINDLIARTLLGAVIGASVLYFVMTVLPMIFPDCPYSTPLTLGIQILARYPSIITSRIIERQSPVGISESRIYDRWDRWYHVFKRLSLPGRRHAFALCRTAGSYQRPVHVLNQMVVILDENNEIHEFVTSLPDYLRSLSLLELDVPHQVWSQFSHQKHLPPLLNRILRSFSSSNATSLLLTPRKVNQLTRLVLLANAAGVNHGDLDALISPKDGWTGTIRGMEVCSHLTTSYRGQWYYLVDERNPVVAFLSHCLLSSVYVVEHYESRKTLGDITLLDDFRGDTVIKGYEQHRDKVLSSLALCGQDFLSIYRLLFFVRVVLYYSAMPESPVAAHQDIWVPVLRGLCKLTMKLDFDRVSPDARVAVWRVFSMIGRDDLIPPLAQTQKYRGPSLNCFAAFEQYPVLEDTLGWLARALTLWRSAKQIQRRKSLPMVLHMLNADSHAESGGYERRIIDFRERRYSYPGRRKSMGRFMALDKDPDIQRRLLASRRGRKYAQEVEPTRTSGDIYDLPDAQEPMSKVKISKLQRMTGWLRPPKLLRRGSQTSLV